MKKLCLKVGYDCSYLNIARFVLQVSPVIELIRLRSILQILTHSSSIVVAIILADNVAAVMSILL